MHIMSLLALFSLVMPSYATTTASTEAPRQEINRNSNTTSTIEHMIPDGTDIQSGQRVSDAEKSFVATRKVVITAYSSTPDQTDNDPFTMANGRRVHDGAIAANFLPFGTKVRIPDLFGDKVFTVGDRMHERFSKRVDIWMPNRQDAIRFGLRNATIEIIL